MKALGKILGLLFLGLLLIIVALGFTLTHVFDPNDYKDEIRQLAREKASVDLTLKGDIGWSLFPWLGLELTDTTVASLDTPEQPFAHLRLLGLSVRVLPLLRKEVQMSDIRIDGLSLDLQRDEKGNSNWNNVGKPTKAATAQTSQNQSEPAATEASNETEQADNSQPLKLDIDSLIVNGARVSYQDAQKGQNFSAESIQVTTGAIREGSAIPVKISAFFGSNKPLLRARSELQGELRFDQALKRYQLEDAKLAGEISGEPFNGQTLNYSAQGQLLVDLAAQVAEWNGLKLSGNQLRALGELKVRDLNSAPKLSGGLSVAPLNLREFLATVGQKLPPLNDDKTLSKFELVTRLSGTDKSLSLDDLKLTLDDSQFTGEVALTDFAQKALRVKLKGNQLDLDRYLPAPGKDNKQATSARSAEVKDSIAKAGESGSTPLPNAPTEQAWSHIDILPVNTLRKLNADIDLSIATFTVEKHTLHDAALQLKGSGGLVTLQNASGKLGTGDINLKGSIDARSDNPQLSAQGSLKNVEIEPFLKKPDQPSPVKGNLDLNADFTAQGSSQRSWVDTLNGLASFNLNNGVLVGANLEQQLCRGIATLNRKSLSGEARAKDTAFETLKGSFTVRNGVADNPDLKARIPGLSVAGNGLLDLRTLGLDYHIGITIEGDRREMPDPACQVNERYVGIAWPVRCRGPLEMGGKACRLDQEGLGKVAAKLAGNKITEKLEEKLGDKVSPELKDAIKGLFR